MGKSTGSRMAGMCQLRGQAAEESHAGTLVPGGHGEEQPGGRRRGQRAGAAAVVFTREDTGMAPSCRNMSQPGDWGCTERT